MSKEIIETFYSSFQRKDWLGMQSCYHAEAVFSDPVFQHLSCREAGAMWHMLLLAGKDLQVTYEKVRASGTTGSCHWDATYTFSRSGRKVLNRIDASFDFKEGKIVRHRDVFSFWRWAAMALGLPGKLLGWAPFLQNKIRSTARKNLTRFIEEHPEYQ